MPNYLIFPANYSPTDKPLYRFHCKPSDDPKDILLRYFWNGSLIGNLGSVFGEDEDLAGYSRVCVDENSPGRAQFIHTKDSWVHSDLLLHPPTTIAPEDLVVIGWTQVDNILTHILTFYKMDVRPFFAVCRPFLSEKEWKDLNNPDFTNTYRCDLATYVFRQLSGLSVVAEHFENLLKKVFPIGGKRDHLVKGVMPDKAEWCMISHINIGSSPIPMGYKWLVYPSDYKLFDPAVGFLMDDPARGSQAEREAEIICEKFVSSASLAMNATHVCVSREAPHFTGWCRINKVWQPYKMQLHEVPSVEALEKWVPGFRSASSHTMDKMQWKNCVSWALTTTFQRDIVKCFTFLKDFIKPEDWDFMSSDAPQLDIDLKASEVYFRLAANPVVTQYIKDKFPDCPRHLTRMT